MVDPQLIEYIKKSQESGVSWDTIKQDLMSAGWTADQIEEAHKVLSTPQLPVPAPKLEVGQAKIVHRKKNYASPYSVLLAIVLLVSLLILTQNAVSDILKKFTPLDKNIISDFSQSPEYQNYLVSIETPPQYPQDHAAKGLFGGYEQYNQEVRDYNNNYAVWENQKWALYDKYLSEYRQRHRISSPSFRLTLHAVLVLPLWVITFLFSIFLKEERKKYGALLAPYYLVSGWLLVYLFFNVAVYIYSANTVWGVYVVLAMLAIILTGAIWGIQKYRHRQEN